MDITTYNKRVGRNFRWLRVHNGFTQQEIGAFLNVTFQQVQKYEQGTNRISAGTVLALSKKMNVPVEWFFTEGLFPDENENNDESPIERIDQHAVKLVQYYKKIASEEVRKLVLMMVRGCSMLS